MAFKASKKRERKAPGPVGRGSPLRPNDGIRVWYAKQLRSVVKPMLADYREEIRRVMDKPAVEKYFGQDAAITDAFTRVLKSLNSKWDNIFLGFARSLAEEFVDKSDDYAANTSKFSLKTAGIKEPRIEYNENVRNTIGASKDFNFTLISGLSSEVHEKLYESVMLSLTSPDPEKQGASGIERALRDVGGFSEKRIDLITRDQTSKVFASLSDQHMLENGVEEFEWVHSSAGKVPRPDHVAKNGMIFKLNDPRLWEGKKADQGPPGWAINCRCAKIPVIRFTDD